MEPMKTANFIILLISIFLIIIFVNSIIISQFRTFSFIDDEVSLLKTNIIYLSEYNNKLIQINK